MTALCKACGCFQPVSSPCQKYPKTKRHPYLAVLQTGPDGALDGSWEDNWDPKSSKSPSAYKCPPVQRQSYSKVTNSQTSSWPYHATEFESPPSSIPTLNQAWWHRFFKAKQTRKPSCRTETRHWLSSWDFRRWFNCCFGTVSLW